MSRTEKRYIVIARDGMPVMHSLRTNRQVCWLAATRWSGDPKDTMRSQGYRCVPVTLTFEAP